MLKMPERRCLVVDDDDIAATFLVELVRTQGLIVDRAGSMRQADQRLAQQRFDILLVDRRLPDGDGVAWLQEALGRTGDGQTPRCLLTSGDQIDIDDLPSGVGQLRKPVDAERLCRWLANDRGPVAEVRGNPMADARTDYWAAMALLDDTAALARLGGNRGALQSLRAMLRHELEDSALWRRQLRAPTPAVAAIDAIHRLRAASALTGCARLGQLGEDIEAGLRRGISTSSAALDDLDKVVADTIAAISAQGQ
jgi:CheY-like chemotaxis protein